MPQNLFYGGEKSLGWKRDYAKLLKYLKEKYGITLVLYFGGVRELALMSGAVVVGTAVALGFAELWIGHVNAQTAFLGAIIAGTGINYGIIFLDRYRAARPTQAFEDAHELIGTVGND